MHVKSVPEFILYVSALIIRFPLLFHTLIRFCIKSVLITSVCEYYDLCYHRSLIYVYVCIISTLLSDDIIYRFTCVLTPP